MLKKSAAVFLPGSKVVIDTNIFISGLINAGYAREVIRAWIEGKFVIVMSGAMLDELVITLRKPRLSKIISKSDSILLITRIKRKAVFVKTTSHISVCRDKEDNKIIAAAIDSHAEKLITGDNDLLVFNPFRGINILSPIDFINRFINSRS